MENIDILVVEDESIISMDIQARLINSGYNVTGAVRSGAAALEFLDKNHADLVLMDIMLEGELDGIDTAKDIMKRHDIPIIYITAYADDVTLRRAKSENTFGYVLKPFNENDLRVTIEMGLFRFKAAMEEKNRLQENSDIGENTKSSKSKEYLSINEKKRIPAWRGDELIVLNPSEVYYLYIDGRNVYIHTKTETYSMRGSLKDWEERLAKHSFFRCHKCYLVNIEKIQKLIACLDSSCLIKMVDLSETIPLSRNRVQSLKDAIII